MVFKMSFYRNILLLFSSIVVINVIECTQVIPVYMWSSKRFSEKIPALRKISQDSFKDDILEHLKYYDFIVAFVEQTLSPEDFAQKDAAGQQVYSNLADLRQSAKVSYLPYVQSPVKALKNIDVSVSEIFVDDIKEKFDIPKADILIVNLNDAAETENRLDMLKRHDNLIASIYKKIAKEDKNVLTLYTAYHESWMTTEEVTNSRRARSLLAAETGTESKGIYNDSNIQVYYTSATYKLDNGNGSLALKFSSTKKANITTVTIDSVTPQIKISLIFSNTISNGYWQLINITANINGAEKLVSSDFEIYAPYGFSYHCGDHTFKSENFRLLIKDFQIQLYENSPPQSNKFDDAYDCVGFTTVPIWSGLFVTLILLLILTFGITMMMDIRTMDRFDDPKGKTITVTAE